MKIRRSMVVLFVMATFIIPVSIYRSMFAEDASAEFLGTVNIIYNVLMGIFLMLIFAFSIFTDDFPHSYNNHKSVFLGFLTMLLAASVGYASVLGLISEDYAEFTGVSGKIFSVIGILSVLALMFYSVTYLKGENAVSSAALIPVFPAFWYGYRMLLCFLKSASMADISGQLPIIAMCCSFTIFLLTVGKLFSCVNSNSIKWGFAAGCIGILTALLYAVNWLINECSGVSELLSTPLIFADLFMACFTIGSLFHISSPVEYFDDEEWDDYFYETYDLPKPNLVLHTPIDELEEDSLLEDDIDEAPYIPVDSVVGNTDSQQQISTQSSQPVPPYAANPAAYASQPSVPPYPPAYPVAPYYPAYPAYPPAYTYPPAPSPAPGYEYYTQTQTQTPSADYYNPYDAAAAQYQYERRRAELQSRELEKLTGEVDNSLARLQNNVTQTQGAANEYVTASPDEKIGGRFNPSPSGRNIRLAQGYIQSGERITDHLDRMERENQQQNQQEYDDSDDDYTYEYYYPTDGNRRRYDSNQFNPGNRNNGNNQNNR